MEFKKFMKAHKDIMLLPVVIVLLVLTVVIIMNKGAINVPFAYSSF